MRRRPIPGRADQLGSLKGQDVGKLIVAAGIIAGAAADAGHGDRIGRHQDVRRFSDQPGAHLTSPDNEAHSSVAHYGGCGVYAHRRHFVPYTQTWGETVAIWFDVLASIASTSMAA